MLQQQAALEHHKTLEDNPASYDYLGGRIVMLFLESMLVANQQTVPGTCSTYKQC